MAEWKDRFEELEARYKRLEEEHKKLKEEKSNTGKSANTYGWNEHSTEFWMDIKNKFIDDPDSIKLMFKNKQVTLQDRDQYNMTLLKMQYILVVMKWYNFY